MANHKIAALLALLVCLAPACAKKPPEEPPEPPPAKPAPGPKLLLGYEELFREIHCDQQKLPLVEVESNALSPERVEPGGEVHHRLIYAFCPAQGGGPEKGVLTRKLTLKGKTVFLDQDDSFVLTPGRTAVDAFFLVPQAAQPGAYVLEVDFRPAGKGRQSSAKPFFGPLKEALLIGVDP
jgi:hypothetical protein